jgi:hypothetical protein
MKPISQAIAAACVLFAGFAAGRFTSQSGNSGTLPLPHQSAKEEAAPKAPADESTDAALCRVAAGDLSAARKRVKNLLSQPDWDMDEMVRLLTAIARRDGKSFDEIIATLPEDKRNTAVAWTIDALASDYGLILQLLTESTEISRVGLSLRIHVASAAITGDPETFAQLIANGKLSWSSETFNNILRRTGADSKVSREVIKLCKSGQIVLDTNIILPVLVQKLFYPDLEELLKSGGQPELMAILQQEMKARPFFNNPDANPQGWKEIDESRLSRGVTDLVESQWLSTIPWNDIPASIRPKLSQALVESGSTTKALDSLKAAPLAAEEKNTMLKSAAEYLFSNGDVNQAVDFANAISTSGDGSNAGQDLIVSWVSYDPVRAQAYVDKVGSTPLSDRIQKRILEVSP